MTEILVQLPTGEGVLRRDDGSIVLAYDITSDHGQPLQPWDRYIPMRVGLDGDRMLFGGVLPPGAVSVEAVEATGVRKFATVDNGVFVVIFSDGAQGEPVLGFRDPDGAFVHRPLPAEYPHEPVEDAEEPCPMCGQIAYEVHFPTEEWRGGSGQKGSPSFVPSPLIVCRVCGVQHESGALMRFTSDSTDEDDVAREARLAQVRAEQAVQRWYQNKMTLIDVPFAVYAAEGWPAQIQGSGSSNGVLTRLVVAHARTLGDELFVRRPQIVIETSVDRHQPGELAVARETFASKSSSRLDDWPSHRLSDAATTLWFRASERRQAANSFGAPVTNTQILIDGTLEPFVTVGTLNTAWVAVRRHGDATVTITGVEIDPAGLTIEPIVNLEARLLGPKPEEP